MGQTLMSAEEMGRAIRRMSHELLELCGGGDDVVLAGVITRGAPLAHRIARELREAEDVAVPVGELDITMYRDDLHRQPTRPVGRTSMPAIDDKLVVLADDVLHSGRTVQAALHALADLGRPRAIRLMVLVDRGGRELPIHPDIVGKHIPSSRQERISVHLAEIDGHDAVSIDRGRVT